MKCIVCGYELSESHSKCPKCGFPVLMQVSGTKEEAEMLEKLAAEYRKKKLISATVSLKVYTNEMVEDTVRVKNEAYVTLAKAEELSDTKISWYPEKFARLSGTCSLKILVTMEEESTEYGIQLENPQVSSLWQVGISKVENRSFRIHLGTPERYVSSKELPFMQAGA